ncbi:MAG: dockerin type I domain-containing protein [Patescibacteria group bacterium]
MPKILSFGDGNPKLPKDGLFKSLWNNFNSLDRFIKFYIFYGLLIVTVTPAIISGYLIFNPHAESLYQVVPVIYLPADFNSDIAAYTSNVKDNFIEVSQWYKQQIGKTFNPADPVVYQSTLSSSHIIAKYPDALTGFANGYFVKYEIPIALSASGKDICDPTKIYYLVTPINVNWGGSGGREFFGCERFPGYASIPGHMGRLIGGIIDPNWPEWWAVEPRQAKGGVAHELAHLFGAYCDTTGCNLTPHNQNPLSIMNAWWDYENPANPVTIDSDALGYINKSSMIIFLTPPAPTPVIPTPTPIPEIIPTSIPTSIPSSNLDQDNDGFSDKIESFIGTDLRVKCPTIVNRKVPNPAYPPDLNGDNRVNKNDSQLLIAYSETIRNETKYNKRFDLNADGVINRIDVQILSNNLGKNCPTLHTSSLTPTPTCIPRPACLDAVPRCLIAETSNMCTAIPTPTP